MQVVPRAIPHEAARVALLNVIDILDSEPEAHFDRITSMAAKLLRTPISLISLVDSERQWFKSRHGLPVSETPRDASFCAHAIQSRDIFVVSDAKNDPRFHDNPLVTGAPHIRFYAGVPVRSTDGVALGTLCVIDTLPRQIRAEEKALLDDLAAVVSRELGHRELAVRGSGNLLFQLEVRADGLALHLTFVTEQLARLVGASKEVLQGDAGAFFGQVHPLDQPVLAARLRTRVDAPAERTIGFKFRLLQAGRRAPRWLQLRATQRRLPDGGLQWNGSLVDISLEHEVEFQQRETDRLRTATALVAAGAHDFNNMLSAMMGLADLCRHEAEHGTRLSRNLAGICSAGRKAAALIRQMLDFARQSPLDLRPSLLAPTIDALLPLVEVGLPRGVALEWKVADDTLVMIDAPQIEQVVHNLVRNAADAMRTQGGLVRITLDTRPAAFSPLNAASVRLAVSDSGCGIADADIGRVFDPFFTTKPAGEGTGLGLSSARGIVVAHGGTIEVDSVVGGGSTFTVWLPALAAAGVLLPALQRLAAPVGEDIPSDALLPPPLAALPG